MPNKINNSHLTARPRKDFSRPVKFLIRQGLIIGPALDYGCGFGYDCENLGIDGYDPKIYLRSCINHDNYKTIKREQYNTIICIYVLNVMETGKKRKEILNHIQSLLSNEGIAYIAVRNDEEHLKGWTSRKTFQTHVELNLPVVNKNRDYILYRLV